MRTFIKNYIDAKKRQKLEETGEEGFSLIELIIVVVILGILVAIAVPIFFNIQATAQTNALRAAAANGATAAAVAFAGGQTAAQASTAAQSAGSNGIAVSIDAGSTSVDTVCATASGFSGQTATSGPGC
jgi:type IV pilus assembly protein PilA